MSNTNFQDPFIPSAPRSFKHNLRNFITSPSWLNRLVIINISVYLLFLIAGWIVNLFGYLGQFNGRQVMDTVTMYLSCPASFTVWLHQPWSIVTNLFVHSGFGHLFFNMLMLYVVGKLFLQFLSQKQLLITYLAGGIFGNLVYMLAYNIFPVFAGVLTDSHAVGASGSIMAIMAAITFYQPNYRLNLLFFGRIKLIWITLIFVAIDLMSIQKGNAGGHIAHVGGVIYGLLYILIYGGILKHSIPWFSGKFFQRRPSNRAAQRRRKKFFVSTESSRPMTDTEFNARKVEEQVKIDRILDKISQYGYDTLTQNEKDFLFKYSKK